MPLRLLPIAVPAGCFTMYHSAAKLSSQGVGKPPRFIRLGDKLDKKPLMEGASENVGLLFCLAFLWVQPKVWVHTC